MKSKIKSLKKNDFVKVYQAHKSKANKYLIMYVLKKDNENRVGISVSKKVGNSVVRHRVKRLIKEAIRLNLEKVKVGYDIVIVARPAAKDKSYKEIESALLHICKLNRILNL